MDYIEIMIRGYTNENDRNFLGKYFIREFKKAENNHYDLEEFFTGLLKAIDVLKNEYQKELFKRKNELYLMLTGAENGTLKYGDLKNENVEEQHKKTIEYCKNELSSIDLGYSTINLLHFTNSRFIGHLHYSEVEFIGNGIAKAYKALNQTETALLNFPNNTENVNKTISKVKSPQDKIESYLYNEINIELYEDFSIHFKTETELLQFFNNLFNEFEFFSNNVNNYVEITNHFVFLDMGYLFWTDEIHFNHKTEHEKLFELFNLYDCLTMLIQFHFPENKRTGVQIKTCEYIIKLGEKIQKLYLPELQKEVPIKTEPRQQEADTSTVGKNSFINNFDNVHESKVIEYFTKNLVDKKYITVDVLNEYLKQAFELKKPPTQRFSFTKLNTQGKIKIVFYEYFKITAGKPIGRKKEYVELLGEYFTGFDTSKLMTNFSK
jgi:hypothetical protein